MVRKRSRSPDDYDPDDDLPLKCIVVDDSDCNEMSKHEQESREKVIHFNSYFKYVNSLWPNEDLFNIGSTNGFLPDGSTPLPEPCLPIIKGWAYDIHILF